MSRRDDGTGSGRGLLQWCVTRPNEGKHKAIREQNRLIVRVSLVTQRLVATWKLDIKSKYLVIPTSC